MSEPVRFRRNLLDRWIILHPTLDDAAWSGSRWVSIHKDGMPSGGVQVSNLTTENDAKRYAKKFGFEVIDESEPRGGER